MHERTTLMVIGADRPLGAEIARLGVAIAYEVVGFAETGPPNDEPWIHGVEWLTSATWSRDILERADAIIVAMPIADMDILRDRTTQMGKRLVVIIEDERAIEPSAHEVVLRPGPYIPFNALEVSEVDDDALALEHVAMAALRCSVEDERHGVYDRESIAHIGDAVMIQG